MTGRGDWLLVRMMLGALVGLMAVGCAGGPATRTEADPPAWVLDPEAAYSRSTHLTAVASGASPGAAEEAAYGKLARIFKADVEARRQLREAYREVQSNGDGPTTRRDTRLLTQSDVRADQTLLNADVLKRAVRDDTYYALVGMERAATRRIYTKEIRSNRRTIEAYRTTARMTNNPVTRLAFLKQALVLARANERLLAQRTIIARRPSPAPDTDDDASVAALRAAVREAQAACPVVVEPKGDVPASVLDQIRATLHEAGFQVADSAPDAALAASVRYRQRPALPNRDQAFVRWTLSIALADRTVQHTLETFTTQQRAGGLSATAAQRRAHHEARTAIQEDFSSFLDHTFLNIDSR